MKSKRGAAPSGEPIDPETLPDEPEDSESEPRFAPAPGVPVSDDEYKRMKEEAEHGPAPEVDNAQEDRPRK
jgi:hypothetical protein